MEETIDDVFRALADSSRRRLLDSLNHRNGQSLRDLSAGLAMTRQSVSKHLAILEAANLVTTVWRGREKLHYLNAAPINAITERWISQYDRGRIHALADLKTALELEPMSNSEFVYTTFIKTSPERLWQALTDPTFTRQYWGLHFETDWNVGSTMSWVMTAGATMADPEQVILISDPYTTLSYTWHSFTPEFAATVGLDDDLRAKLLADPRSKVTFTLEPQGQIVKLTVVHDGIVEGSTVIGMVSEGWPRLISDIKTFLETGEPLPASDQQEA